jgi:hypothetical protein
LKSPTSSPTPAAWALKLSVVADVFCAFSAYKIIL